MKEICRLSLVALIIALFSGAAIGQSPDAPDLLAVNQDSLQAPKETCLPSQEPQKDADDAPAKADKDKDKSDKISDIVKTKIDEKCKEEPIYCRPLFDFWCQQICGSVSPWVPGGAKKWGKKCNPGLLSKCERCGFL